MYESFWQTLSQKSKPIFIYGTGNGADKIIDILSHFGVSIAGIFASDGFVRNRTFRSFPVRAYGDVRREYGDDIIVIVAFGSSLTEVLDFIDTLDTRHELYIPEVPLFCDDLLSELFDDRFYKAHLSELNEVRDMLSDEESVALFDDMIAHRLTGKLQYLRRTERPCESLRGVLDCSSIKYAIDGGAFKGDTAELFCDVFTNLEVLTAVEPDPRSFKKLSTASEIFGDNRIIPLNAMLDDFSGDRIFFSSGSRGSAPDAAIPGSPKRSKEIKTPCMTVDQIVAECMEENIDFIKLDTEGFEAVALNGAKESLKKNPSLMISLYHRSRDIFELPLFIKKFYPDGRFYLRRPMCIPEWDLTLFVTK